MALSLVVVAGATGGGAGTVTLDVTAARDGNRVTYTVKMNAGENRVAAMQFLLTPSTGMKMVSDRDYHTEDFENTFVSENDEGTSFGAFGFTYSTGKYVAYGGNVEENNRYLTGDVLIMTATYTIEDEAETPYLTVSEFIACKSKVISDADRYDCQVTTPTVPVPPLPGAGITITGTITSYNANNTATVQLMNGENVVKTVTDVTDKFTLESVPAGTYDLVVTKAAHLTYTIKNITVGSDDIDLTKMEGKPYQTIALLCGDVNGDGRINNFDYAVVMNPLNFNKSYSSPSDVKDVSADVNGDGKINNFDYAIIMNPAHFNKNTSACTIEY